MAGFPINYGAGKLVFGSYTIPNAAVKLQEEMTLDLWFPDYQGEDVDTVASTVIYPRVAKSKKVNIALYVTEQADAAGTAATNRAEQLKKNIDALVDIAAQSLNTTTPTQTVVYTPWVGATSINITALVLPPVIGTYKAGVGVKAVLPMVLPNNAIYVGA